MATICFARVFINLRFHAFVGLFTSLALRHTHPNNVFGKHELKGGIRKRSDYKCFEDPAERLEIGVLSRIFGINSPLRTPQDKFMQQSGQSTKNLTTKLIYYNYLVLDPSTIYNPSDAHKTIL